MAVKIEILDYKRGEGGNLVDFNLGTPATGWSVSQINNQRADFTNAGLSGGTYYFNDITPNLIGGRQYDLKIIISNYSGTGNIGVSSGDPSGTQSGVGSTFRHDGNQTITGTFTWNGNATGGLRVFGKGTNSGTIAVELTDDNGIVWEKSIVGELDVTNHVDFPLALTFQISDIKDITSTSGDYSKTFKIPATKNNNKILKHQYITNSEYSGEHISIMRDCRILVNDFYSLVGKIKVTGISGYGETPSNYDCVFFGNNLGWAKELDGKYMDETFGDGYGLWGSAGSQLEYNKTKIMATWADENCDSSTSPIVYPVVSYGDYNPDGTAYTIQLLDTAYDYNQTGSTSKIGYYGFFDTVGSYNTPTPSPDWRPAVFVKTTIDAIFSKLGYNVSSDFMNTDMFKKLVWLLPNFKYNNPEDRVQEYSVEYKLLSERSITFSATGGIPAQTVPNFFTYFEDGSFSEDDLSTHYTGDDRQLIGLANSASPFGTGYNIETILDENSRLVLADDNVVIGEYGFYDLTLPNFQVQVTRCFKGGSGYQEVYDIDTCINLELNTVGQTSWTIIGQIQKGLHPHNANGNHSVNQNNASSTGFENTTNLVLERYWLNKGDKIRLTRGIRIPEDGASSDSQNFHIIIMWRNTGSSKFTISISPEIVEYGQTFDLSKVINSEYKQIDFIKGVSHAFNLTLTTNEVTKTVSIEPFNDFYKTYGFAVDWTHKLDRIKEIKDAWVKSDLKRSVTFKYKSDEKDQKVKDRGDRFFNKIHDEYPYWEELSDAFERGNSVFENPFFAGTYNAQDSDGGARLSARPAYSACLWENANSTAGSGRGNTPKGYDFLPRLLYWNKYSPATAIDASMEVEVQTWAGVTQRIIPDASQALISGTVLSNVFPQATSNNRFDVDSPVLSYGNVWIRDYDDASGVYAAAVSGKGLFETYYKKMFTMIQSSPRIRTVFVDLHLSDIINLDFRKLVYIDGVYWRINRILDYQPNKNTTTKVELLQWIETGAFAATAPSFGNFNNTNWGTGVYHANNDVAETDDGTMHG